MTTRERRGRCDEMVEVQDSGEGGSTEVTSPWLFVEHRRPRTLGTEVIGIEVCPGTGRNAWLSEHSL